MLKIQPKQATYRGDYITAKVDNLNGTVDVTLSMNGQVETVTAVFADVIIGDVAMYLVSDEQRGFEVWEHVPIAEFNKWCKVQGG